MDKKMDYCFALNQTLQDILCDNQIMAYKKRPSFKMMW